MLHYSRLQWAIGGSSAAQNYREASETGPLRRLLSLPSFYVFVQINRPQKSIEGREAHISVVITYCVPSHASVSRYDSTLAPFCFLRGVM